MGNKTWMAAAGFVGICFAVVLFSPQLGPQRHAVAGLVMRLRGGNHSAIVAESAVRAAGASYNLAVIERAGSYIATTGSNTATYRGILRIAAAADHECPLLSDALDLAVRKQSESKQIVALAEAACRVKTAEDEAAWRTVFDRLAQSAEYDTVEEALAGPRVR